MKLQEAAAIIPLMLAMGGLQNSPYEKSSKPYKRPEKKRDCKICGEPVYHDSLTCSKKCFLEHRDSVKNAV